jgi:hypothetical protein
VTPHRRATTDLTVALANGYIGEVRIMLKPIAHAVHVALTGRRIRPVTVYYYGARDSELDELFGYGKH